MYVRLSLILVFVLVPGATQQDIPEIRTRIDRFVSDLIQCYSDPGITVAVVKDDQVKHVHVKIIL